MTTVEPYEPTPGGRRAAAITALGTLVVALVFVGVAVGRRWELVVGCLLTLAVAVTALWWVVSRRGTPRLVAAIVAAVALAAFVVTVLLGTSLVVVLVAAALTAVSVSAARLALHVPVHVPLAAPPAERAVLFMNPRSGGGKVELHDLPSACRRLGVEPVLLAPGDDLRELAERAVADGADLLGMAGGDGSQALVADAASRAGVPFVVVPAGTRNHLALDLGIDRADVAGALQAFVDGVERTVDLADVNGRVFVNNASMGAYARVVQSAEYRDAKVRTTLSVLPDVLGPDAPALDLSHQLPSGETRKTAHLLLVSNNPYSRSPLLGGSTRDRLDRGALGIVSLLVRSPGDPAGQDHLDVGRRGLSMPGLTEWAAPELVVDSAGPVEIGIDGEAQVLDPPLHFNSRPGVLVVRVTRDAYLRSANARLRMGSAITELWRTATGGPTSDGVA